MESEDEVVVVLGSLEEEDGAMLSCGWSSLRSSCGVLYVCRMGSDRRIGIVLLHYCILRNRAK